jgi:hypothetical protein
MHFKPDPASTAPHGGEFDSATRWHPFLESEPGFIVWRVAAGGSEAVSLSVHMHILRKRPAEHSQPADWPQECNSVMFSR